MGGENGEGREKVARICQMEDSSQAKELPQTPAITKGEKKKEKKKDERSRTRKKQSKKKKEAP